MSCLYASLLMQPFYNSNIHLYTIVNHDFFKLISRLILLKIQFFNYPPQDHLNIKKRPLRSVLKQLKTVA